MTTRRKRDICFTVAIISFLFILGIAGGADQYGLNLGVEIRYMAIGLIVFIAALYKGGYI
jgi:hypothetical protein